MGNYFMKMGCNGKSTTSVNNFNIEIGTKCIIVKMENGVKKEQYATIDTIYDNNNYGYNYGTIGFHEGNCNRKNIREPNAQEKIYIENNQFWELPQQFYQSM